MHRFHPIVDGARKRILGVEDEDSLAAAADDVADDRREPGRDTKTSPARL
jgi:hypothetical protein